MRLFKFQLAARILGLTKTREGREMQGETESTFPLAL